MRDVIHRFDTGVTNYIAAWPIALKSFFLFITAIGDPLFTVSIGAIVVIWGVMQHNVRLTLAGSLVWVTLMFGFVIKLLTARARPLTEYAASMHIKTFSFPSGHTSGSTIAYGLLAYLAWHMLPQPWNYIATVLLVALIIIVGVSRVYLGAHFPSDVVAGWILGLIVLLVVIYAVRPLA